MASEPEPHGGRKRRRRLASLARLFLVLALLAALLYLFRGPLLAPLLVRAARAHAARALGAELAIERVGGSWFGDLELSGLRWRAEGSPLARVEEGHLRARYSLWRWMKGEADWIEELALHARGVELVSTRSPGESGATPALVIPALELEVEDATVQIASDLDPIRVDALRARGSLSGERVSIAELEASSGPNQLALHDAALDLGARTLPESLRRARGALDLALPDGRFLQRSVSGRPLPLRSLVLELSLLEGRAKIEGRADLAGGALVVERGELALPAEAPLDQTTLDLRLGAHFDDLAPLGEFFGYPLGGSWVGLVDVTGRLVAPAGRLMGRGERVQAAGLVLDALELDVETDGERARIERLDALGADFEAHARGAVRLEPFELEGVELSLRASAPPAFARIPFPLRNLEGRAMLSGPPGSPSGELEASATDLVLGPLDVQSARLRGRLERGALEVDALALALSAGSVEASGRVARAAEGYAAELRALGLDWEGNRIELGRPAPLAFGPGRFSTQELELRSGDARSLLSLDIQPGNARIALELEDFDPQPFGEPFLPDGWRLGRVSGRLEGLLVSGERSLSAALAIRGLRPGPEQPDWTFDLRGKAGAGRLELESLVARSSDDQAIDASLRMPFDPARALEPLPGDVALRLDFRTGDLVRWTENVDLPLHSSGPARVAADLTGTWEGLTGTLGFQASQLVLAGRRTNPGPWDVQLELGLGQRMELRRAELASPSGRMNVQGQLELPCDLPAVLAAPRAFLEAPVTARAELDLPDLAWVAELSSTLRRLAGRASGTLSVSGTLAEPSFSGKLELREGELRLASNVPPARDLSADLTFEGRSVRIESVAAEIGGAPVRARGTVEPFARVPRLDLELSGENLLVARTSHLRLRADSRLTVRGPLDRLLIAGDLVLTEGRYTFEVDLLEQIAQLGSRTSLPRRGPIALWREPPFAQAELEVRVKGRGLAVETNLVEASLRPDLLLLGTAEAPTLEGHVYLDRASFTLPSGHLDLRSGVLDFSAERPFRPSGALSAEMRVQRYDVQATVTGSLDELEIALTSDPPLAHDDLWVLVLTGQPPAEQGTDRSAQAMESLALFLARDRVVRWLSSDKADATSLLERFEIDVGAKTSKSGQPTGRALFYLKPRSARSGRATYLSAELDEYDRMNFALGIVFRPR